MISATPAKAPRRETNSEMHESSLTHRRCDLARADVEAIDAGYRKKRPLRHGT